MMQCNWLIYNESTEKNFPRVNTVFHHICTTTFISLPPNILNFFFMDLPQSHGSYHNGNQIAKSTKMVCHSTLQTSVST